MMNREIRNLMSFGKLSRVFIAANAIMKNF